MRDKTIFSGVATALITPFKNSEIDFDALGKIIDFQLDSGFDALVIAGTTGEASTLSESERYALYEFAKAHTGGAVPLIFGTGSNDTKTALKYTRRAAELGADAALVVTPYYNKGTAGGIISHYQTIANSTDLPIILYNVPSRTGVNLSIDAVRKLAEHENIIALKEASDSADRLVELSELTDSLTLYSGNDTQTHLTLSLGGAGVISVASNIAPGKVLNITQSFARGDIYASLCAQKALLPLCRAIFLETNPSPIKYLMSKAGFCAPDLRLPLSEPSEHTKRVLDGIADSLQK